LTKKNSSFIQLILEFNAKIIVNADSGLLGPIFGPPAGNFGKDRAKGLLAAMCKLLEPDKDYKASQKGNKKKKNF
jgi:hypothetical protein